MPSASQSSGPRSPFYDFESPTINWKILYCEEAIEADHLRQANKELRAEVVRFEEHVKELEEKYLLYLKGREEVHNLQAELAQLKRSPVLSPVPPSDALPVPPPEHEPSDSSDSDDEKYKYRPLNEDPIHRIARLEKRQREADYEKEANWYNKTHVDGTYHPELDEAYEEYFSDKQPSSPPQTSNTAEEDLDQLVQDLPREATDYPWPTVDIEGVDDSTWIFELPTGLFQDFNDEFLPRPIGPKSQTA